MAETCNQILSLYRDHGSSLRALRTAATRAMVMRTSELVGYRRRRQHHQHHGARIGPRCGSWHHHLGYVDLRVERHPRPSSPNKRARLHPCLHLRLRMGQLHVDRLPMCLSGSCRRSSEGDKRIKRRGNGKEKNCNRKGQRGKASTRVTGTTQPRRKAIRDDCRLRRLVKIPLD